MDNLTGPSGAGGDAMSEGVDEPRAGEMTTCPNCQEVWPARLAEARGEIARLTAAYDRDVQVDRQQYADALQHAADLRATADLFYQQRNEYRDRCERLREIAHGGHALRCTCGDKWQGDGRPLPDQRCLEIWEMEILKPETR